MKYKIVLVPFPFDDLSKTKVRPAICLTNEISTYQHVVIAFITSQIEKANESSDFPILSKSLEFEETGLKRSSAIRLHRLLTIPIHIIRRDLGILPQRYEQELKVKLKNLLDL